MNLDQSDHRLVILDTETTGLEASKGHRIIEIGCVELIDRRLTHNNYHVYLNPQRKIDEGAEAVHGISREFLQDKPLFSTIVNEFLNYIKGAELVIHNAPFDIGFLEHELHLAKIKPNKIINYCQIIDTLVMARSEFPGQRNNLDALCKRYNIDNSQRTLHGALLDSEILADVYLRMTGGQVDLDFASLSSAEENNIQEALVVRKNPCIILPTDDELNAHQAYLVDIEKASGIKNDW